jgi:Ca2+-binding EF-hand superfamily protein
MGACSSTTAEVDISPTLLAAVKELFDQMDEDKDGKVMLSEAEKFWAAGKLGKFGKMSAVAMFNEVDDDANKSISYQEWVSFWANVKNSPEHSYPEEEIIEEVQAMLKGEAWRDWDDGKSTTKAK